MTDVLFYYNYVSAADVCTIIICIIYWLLLKSTYTIKQKNLTMFQFANALVLLAAATSIYFHYLMDHLRVKNIILIYLCRDISYISLILTFAVLVIYIKNLLTLTERHQKILNLSIWLPFSIFVISELTTPLTKFGFYIDSNLKVHENYYLEPFRFSYVYYLCLIMILLIIYRKKFVTKMFQCIRNIILISFLVMFVQAFFIQTSYVCITFTFPFMAMLFMFHYNSYDAETGTLDSRSFNAYIKDLRNKNFSLICIHLDDMNLKNMQGLSEYFYHFGENFFKKSCTFRLRDDRLVIVYEDELNSDAKRILPLLLEDFDKLNEKYRMDYQIVLIHSDIILIEGDEYLALNEFIEERIPINTVYECTNKDMENYLKSAYILSELRDIHLRADLDDNRVKVFCQPVLNTETNTFSSAEALMRMKLKECGMVFPDQFIPLAEKHAYIHTLSKIILNKTCKQIKEFELQGYQIDRVSVNFSILELRDKNFCSDIIQIINDNDIEFGKIAIELTESRNEQDFEMVKNIMMQLQELGIKFYLDDFGTGYSNFERITSLPIDIIKFDRSLTILAEKSEESRFLVESFSDIFKKSNYQILFEGVEDDRNENHCKEMNASYLQGYKYSKPIPMEQLTNFLNKEA